MENLVKKSKKRYIYGMEIDESLKKYENDPRVLKKLAEDEKWIEENGGYEAIFEALRRYGVYDTPTVELSVAHEPQAEYGAPKKTEELYPSV